MTAALEKVRAAQQPSTPPAQGTRPTDAERQAREKARVTALAKELGVTEAKVQAALDAIKADREASRRTELTTRLDAAVKAGTLSAADKASVLKAFDAGVLGGRPPDPDRPPRPGRTLPRRRLTGVRRRVPAGTRHTGRTAARRAIGAGMPGAPASIW